MPAIPKLNERLMLFWKKESGRQVYQEVPLDEAIEKGARALVDHFDDLDDDEKLYYLASAEATIRGAFA